MLIEGLQPELLPSGPGRDLVLTDRVEGLAVGDHFVICRHALEVEAQPVELSAGGRGSETGVQGKENDLRKNGVAVSQPFMNLGNLLDKLP